MVANVVKSIFLVLLGGLSVATMTWGLSMIGSNSVAVSYAVFGLLAYLASWIIGLWLIAR